MDLIHPHSAHDVAESLRAASADGTRVLIVGGRRHIDHGNPSAVDAELWTTLLDQPVAHDPAEMLCVVEAGMRLGDLRAMLADGGQEWPVDEPDDATVGGVIAADVALPRQLRVGTLRDTVVEMEVVTADGRRLRSGARTVKNATGYDLHRLLTGSLGTLAVITQVALKVRPLSKASRTLATSDGGLELGARLLERVPMPAAVLAEHDRVMLLLEGWPEEVEEQVAAAATVAMVSDAEPPVSAIERFPDAPILAQVAVPPSSLPAALKTPEAFGALMGVGYAWVPCGDENELADLRAHVREAGGLAPVIRGLGGLGDDPFPAPEIQRRIKAVFDPAGILAPGRAWAGGTAEG